MADIPVERQSTGNWWKWLLGLALLALVIWLIAAMMDPGEDSVEEPIEDPIEQPTEQPGQQPPEQSSEQPGDDPGPGANVGQDGAGNSAYVLRGAADEARYAHAVRIDIAEG